MSNEAILNTILSLFGLLLLFLCCVEALCVSQVINSDGQEHIQQDV